MLYKQKVFLNLDFFFFALFEIISCIKIVNYKI